MMRCRAGSCMPHAACCPHSCPQAFTFQPATCGVLGRRKTRQRSCQRSRQQHKGIKACSSEDRPAAQRSLDSLDLLLGSSSSLDSTDAAGATHFVLFRLGFIKLLCSYQAHLMARMQICLRARPPQMVHLLSRRLKP